MAYVRITIALTKGGTRSGIRVFPEPINLPDIRKHAWKLAAEVLGRGAIVDVTVHEVAANDPAVVALILHEHRKTMPITPSTGQHPYVKQQHRRPPR